MPEQRDNDKERLLKIDAVLAHLQQVKTDTVKMMHSLLKERTQKRARVRKAQKRR